MTRNPNPGRQPLLWAALMFSAGVWVGARAWRPAAWWIVAVLGFALATLWFLRRRSWVAKGLSLGTWFVLGAFLIQIRSAPGGDAGILAFADGREVTIEAHVAREGYARAAGPRSIRQPVDVETEAVEGLPIRAGVRLTIYEKIEDQGLPCEASTTSGDPTSAAKADPDKQFFAALKRCATQNPGTQNPSTQNPRVDLISQNGRRRYLRYAAANSSQAASSAKLSQSGSL